MQIIFDEDDIKTALANHATSMVTVKEDMEITIDMKAGRGDNGYSATLNIQPKVVAAPAKAGTKTTQKPAADVSPKATVAAVTKTGLFNSKPTAVVMEAQKEEPAPAPEPVSSISTGEERLDPANDIDEVAQELDDSPDEVEPVSAAEPAEKPKSIFNFAKPAAAAG